jgi:hypothetical protein
MRKSPEIGGSSDWIVTPLRGLDLAGSAKPPLAAEAFLDSQATLVAANCPAMR